ncbi:MAG: BREX-2 system phosphatase PglZ [Deltaproteobacteria bacterium]|nr:BREX-2 system phosphatase PglZ [Deltaproteobacteria bacterium]
MRSDLLLHKLLEAAGGPAERGYVLALDGSGLDAVPERVATSRASYAVYRPQTELEIRHILWKMQGAPFIALVKEELAHRLPADIVKRAQGARAHAVDESSVLGAAIGVPLVGTDDPAVLRLAMDHVDELAAAVRQRTLPTVIDRQLLDELLVDVCTDTRLRADKPGALLASWIEHPPGWSEAVRDLVRRTLPRLHASEGKVLAWALGGPGRLEAIVIRGPLLELVREPPEELWGELQDARLGRSIELADHVLAVAVSSLGREALDLLSPQSSAALLQKAESIGRRLLPKSCLERSSVLPLGLECLCAGVARQAAQGHAVPAGVFQEIRAHRSARTREAEIDLLEEIARLSRYLASEPPQVPGGVGEQVRRYLRDGAFADLAALRLRRFLAATHEHRDGAGKVLEAWRQRRDEGNLAFAKTLAAGYVQALHSAEVVPLHRLWTNVVFKGQAPDGAKAPVFVVVLDGCSCPVFIELVWSLSQRADGALGLGLDESGVACGLPALAPLPTVTSHARGAIFLGDIPHDPWLAEARWRDAEEAATDPARFKRNSALGTRTRRMFLKGDLGDGGGELLQVLADPAVEVVAAVFNAVDDQIGSSNTGAVIRVKPDDVVGLLPSLRAALKAGRRVLVVADHGHTPFLRKDLRAGARSTARFLEIGPKDTIPQGFLEIDVGDLGGTKGRKAFAWSVGVYQGSAQVGFHGGCGLEEMVVPLAWLVPSGVHANEPSWWFGGVPAGEDRAPLAMPLPAGAGRAPAPRPVPVGIQTDLFDPRHGLEARALGIDRIGLAPLTVELLGTVERAALVVLHENHTVRTQDLARALGKPVQRIDGLMAQLHRKLHRAQEERFRSEQLPSGELQYHYVPPAGGAMP